MLCHRWGSTNTHISVAQYFINRILIKIYKINTNLPCRKPHHQYNGYKARKKNPHLKLTTESKTDLTQKYNLGKTLLDPAPV